MPPNLFGIDRKIEYAKKYNSNVWLLSIRIVRLIITACTQK